MTLRALLLGCVVAAGTASAQTLEIVGPSAFAPPEGFDVAVLLRADDGSARTLERPVLSVGGGTAAAVVGQGRLWSARVIPEEGAREVRVTAEAAGRRAVRIFQLGPPAAEVAVTLVGSAPVKGRDTQVGLEVRVLRPDGSVDPDAPLPVLRANVGRIEDLSRTAPGRFQARYVLPDTKYPEVAVIVAFAPWPQPQAVHGAFGTLLVPLASSIDLPGSTEPGAEMSIEIAGVVYGPTRAGPDGRFLLPVVVPPGHRFGRGVARDRAGNRRTSRIDLMLPPTDQLACVMNPRRLPADGRSQARVICATTDPFGAPHASARVRLEATAGTLSKVQAVHPGVFEWRYTAPTKLPQEPVRLEAQWTLGRNVSRERFEVELVQGPVSSVALTVSERQIHYGGVLRFRAEPMDAAGRLRPDVVVEPRVSFGALTKTGALSWTWTPPDDGEVSDVALEVDAWGPPGAHPSQIVAWREEGALFAAVQDLAGWPVPQQMLRIDGREVRTNDQGVVRLPELTPGTWVLQHTERPGISQTIVLPGDGTVWPEARRPGFARATQRVLLAPPVPVNVRITVEGRSVTYWAETPKGEPLPDRPLALSIEGARAGTPRHRAGRTTVIVEGPAQISVADVETGVTALAQVP